MKTGMVLLAAPVASADAKLLLSGAPESNQRAPRGGAEEGASLDFSPLWTPPAIKVSCGREVLFGWLA